MKNWQVLWDNADFYSGGIGSTISVCIKGFFSRFKCFLIFFFLTHHYKIILDYVFIRLSPGYSWWLKAQRDIGSLCFKKQCRKLFMVKLVRLWNQGHRGALNLGINEQNVRKYAMGKADA